MSRRTSHMTRRPVCIVRHGHLVAMGNGGGDESEKRDGRHNKPRADRGYHGR